MRTAVRRKAVTEVTDLICFSVAVYAIAAINRQDEMRNKDHPCQAQSSKPT